MGTWKGAVMFFLNDCFLLFKSAVNGADLGVINNVMSSNDEKKRKRKKG